MFKTKRDIDIFINWMSNDFRKSIDSDKNTTLEQDLELFDEYKKISGELEYIKKRLKN